MSIIECRRIEDELDALIDMKEQCDDDDDDLDDEIDEQIARVIQCMAKYM